MSQNGKWLYELIQTVYNFVYTAVISRLK